MPGIAPPRWIPRLEAFAARFQLWRPGDRILLAVSGGADSVAMARLLSLRAEAWGLQLAIAHFDHAWRPDSARDADFVAALAAQLRLPCHLGRAAAPPARDREQHARRARYAFLLDLAARESARVATAHTADDQAETVLLRLLRGSGPTGAAGVLPERDGGAIIRPMLWARRADLREWLTRLGQPWLEDPANLDPALARVRVRTDLIPRLEADYNPAIVPRLADAAEIARAEEEYWAGHVARLAGELMTPVADGGVRLPVAALARLTVAEQRRLLREAIRRVQGDLRRVDFAAIEDVLTWMAMPATHTRRRHCAGVEFVLGRAFLDVVLGDLPIKRGG